MSVERPRPRGQRSGSCWGLLARALAVVAIAATCVTAEQPARALAAQVSAPASVAATPGATIKRSDPRALLFLGNKNIAPVVYLDVGVPSGLAVDMVRALATHLPRPVEIVAMDWKQAQALVATGQADALIQINSTPERTNIYDFSEPFLESHFAIFVRANQTGVSGVSSLHGLRVGVESGGLPQQLLGKDPQIPLTVIPDFPEAFRMLDAGTIDAVVVDYRVGAYVLATKHFEGIKTAGDPIASSYSGIAVQKGNTALLNEINQALRAIKADGTYQKILDNWAPTQGVFETQGQINETTFVATIIVLVVLLAIAIAWAVTIRAQMSRKRLAEEALRTSQRKLALHLEQTMLGVIEWDTDFCAREWNPAAEAIFGYTREEALGRRVTDLILPEAVQADVEVVWQSLLHQAGGQFNTNENVTKDGRTIVCEWVNTPLVDDDGNVVGVMSLARDVTERRQAEQLRVAQEAAEAANVAKSAFLAHMSHEIRTPMNAILGFSQLMRRDEGLSERQHQQLEIINNSGEHLLALINDVLEMSKVEAGGISVNPTAFSLYTLLDEMESLFGLRARAKGLQLHVICSEDVPRFVVADENKLRQVFVNLLGNAMKFTDKGAVELRVGAQREEGGKIRLLAQVEDTGRGIAPEDMGQLFQFFEQVAAGSEMQTGTGLGLAISREFVKLLGGEITVDSRPGAGSVFKFDVVVEQAAADAVTGKAEARRVLGLRPDGPCCRILVADDAPDNRELLVQLLETVGFDVKAVANGEQALEEFEAWQPQLVLMDMRMPVMDGYEATRRIRSTPAGADVAIIGVATSAFAEMRQGEFDAGVDEFVVKPFRESEIFDKIGKLLGVKYVYEEGPKTRRGAAEGLDAAAIAALPPDLLSRLRQATMIADFDAVLALAEEIGRVDQPSAAGLRAAAERFDAECILDALGEVGQS